MHIGIIPDGNRRFAKQADISQRDAYLRGFQVIKDIITHMSHKQSDLGIYTLTLYVCSKDNLTKRPAEEVAVIHEMLEKFITYFNKKHQGDPATAIKVNIIGNIKRLLPSHLYQQLKTIQRRSRHSAAIYTLNLAIGYDPWTYTKRLVLDENRRHPVAPIDAVIRTGYEKRISGFFPMQIIYAELYFLDKYFPEFTIEDLKAVVADFRQKDRRYGK
jgi:undecaprenyl pyrophosphate synthase